MKLSSVFKLARNSSQMSIVSLGALAILLTGLKAEAISITRNFTGGAAPGNASGGGSLVDIFNTAADWWEEAIQDDASVTIDFGWAPQSGNTLAEAEAVPGAPNPINPVPSIGFDNDGSNVFFVDSTPGQNEEYQTFNNFSDNFGGGTVNTGRVYSNAPGDVAGQFDLLSVATHEIGHTLGFIGPISNPLTVTDPRPLAGTEIPIDFQIPGGPHVDVSTASIFPTFEAGERKLLSDLDILAVAEFGEFEEINLNPQQVPEPLTILGSAIVLGMGFLMKKRQSKLIS